MSCVLIVFVSEVRKNVGKVVVLFLHFLVMTSTLFCLSSSNKDLHCLKYFVCPAHVTVDEVLVMDLQEPVVSFVLLRKPMPVILLLQLLFTLF